MTNIVLIALVAVALLYRWKLGHTMNPPTLVTIGFAVGLGAVVVGNRLAITLGTRTSNPYDDFELARAYALGLACFLIPWLTKLLPSVGRQIEDRGDVVYDHKGAPSVAYGLVLGTLFSVALAVLLLGSVPIVDLIAGRLEIGDIQESKNGLPLGLLGVSVILQNILGVYFASFAANREKYGLSRTRLVFLAVACVLGGIWSGSRQLIAIYIFYVVARFGQPTHGRRPLLAGMGKFALIVALLVGFTFFFNSVASFKSVRSSGSQYELLEYAAWPGLNTLAILQAIPSDGVSWGPGLLLSEIVPRRIWQHEDPKILDSILYEFTSPSGYLASWYVAYGFLGIGLGALLAGSLARYTFDRRTQSETAMRTYLLVLWACSSMFIYSHFLNLTFFIAPFVILLVEQWVLRPVSTGSARKGMEFARSGGPSRIPYIPGVPAAVQRSRDIGIRELP